MGEAGGVRRREGRRWPRTAAAALVLLALAGYAIVQYVSTGGGAPRCVVRGAEGEESFELDPEMARNAATISAVATARGLPERAVTIGLATAMQESGLRNIDYGDRDSVGLFQQRPSQGWGDAEQIMDPVYAAGKFYDHLVEVPGYTELPLTVAAQRVQRSAYPDAYAKHEPRAGRLTEALTGKRAAALYCTGIAATKAGDAGAMRSRLLKEFGPDVAVPADTGGGRSAPAGQVVLQVPEGSRRGWELAHWALANAAELGVERVAHGGRVWDVSASGEGWRSSDASGVHTDEVRITLVPGAADAG
ncbi:MULTISPECIES: heavy metal transporter [unclassified Streptomyces]|uniref:heavy metal transporter n=1 Tax=unclassified Streptomyces TaxID=2593676 RepID=UPI0022B62288|nr:MULTISPECIES: heavy metal transporter [unclassified Streptomyces]MCZ7416709.1 heavy metal transporter [Streptomyces sp. WMMC897]MCZ7433481.1 heavy metal transporter [Streptomyces sp. WMMC1477]